MGSEIGIKGYVVRGTDSEGEAVSDDCADLASAIHTWRDWNRCTLSILAVAEDGTETPLPSYEEALAHLAAVREALAITFGETATGAARRTAVALAQAREEIERLEAARGALAERHQEAERQLHQAIAKVKAENDRLRSVAPILINGVPAIMHSSAPASREEIGAAACQMLKAIERALSVLQGSERLPTDPLAALEAAERRLLEAGGWTPDEDDVGYWRDRQGRTCKQAVAILQERRLAAKGRVS